MTALTVYKGYELEVEALGIKQGERIDQLDKQSKAEKGAAEFNARVVPEME